MLIQTSYSFLPVGQGTFATGSLKCIDKNNLPFRWVYDCGCVDSRQKQLISEIDRLASITARKKSDRRPHLDLVFISHFDSDHISGLIELLSRFEVDVLVLPMIPIWQRLVIATSVCGVKSTLIRNFLINPLKFIANIKGSLVRQVYLVPPSIEASSKIYADATTELSPLILDGIPELKPTEIIDLPTDEDNIEFNSENLSLLPFSVKALAPGAKLIFGNFWEFLPYNEPKLKIKATLKFQAAVARVTSTLLNASHSDRTRILNRLKGIYQETYGKRSKQRNQISLFVFAGPIGKHVVFNQNWSTVQRALKIPKINWSDPCFGGQCYFCSYPDAHSHKSGILYTGDGYLKSSASFNDLKNHLGNQRINNLRIFQVMHHGSRANWHKGLATKLSPITSIFCADPEYTYKHPHKEVSADFLGYGPQLVNWESGFTSFQTFKW